MELAKGVRDFGPEEMQLRSEVLSIIKEEFTLYGFESLETPIIERLETLTAKSAGSEGDVAKEIFKVEDQGGRELGLRFDLTVPLSRYVASHKELKFPFRRYEIGRVYRDGPIKLGRYREFVQCDADIVGSKSMLADAECIHLAAAVFSKLAIPCTIKVNNRAILDAVCKKYKIKNSTDVIITLDKLEKIGKSGVSKELTEKGVSKEQQEALFNLLLVEGTNAGKLKMLEEEVGNEPLKELRELLAYLQIEVEFSPSLSRGLAYYTGTVFEAFAIDSKITGSLMGGGRYDQLVGKLKGADTPAVGISFGIEPICEVLKERRSEEVESDTKIFVIPIGNATVRCAALIEELREHDISCSIDLLARSVTKNIEYASKLRIPYAIIIGDKDIAEGNMTLKDLRSGDEKKIPLSEIASLRLELSVS